MSGPEKLTKNSLLKHMSDNPCIICGISGHNAWDEEEECLRRKDPTNTQSPLTKIYGALKANQARLTILNYCKTEKPLEKPSEPIPDAQVSAPVDPETQARIATDSDNLVLNPILEGAGKSVDGLSKVRDITETEPVETHAANSVALSQTALLGPSNNFTPDTVVSKAKTAQFPLRKEFAQSYADVFTNHFEVNFKSDTRFFLYEILKIPAGKSKRKAKFIFKTIEQAWPILKDNKQYYATDRVKTIVAWKNIHEAITYAPVILGDPNTHAGSVWMPDAIADGSEKIQLFIKFHRELDLDGMYAYIDASSEKSDPDFNFSPIVNALNIAVTKSLTANAFQQSSNKFFVKCGSERLGGNANLQSLCTIRGYYYTIKPGMQKVLLNVNAATSAFFRPITVGEFLADTTFPYDERMRLLGTLRVYIEPDRLPNASDQEHVDHLNKPQNRIKTFFGLGPLLNAKEMSFQKTWKNDQGQWVIDPKRTRVVDHMKAIFGQGFDEKLESINVGTEADPVHYPREYLRIMPYQIYKRLLPESLVEGMLNNATHLPKESRRLVEIEGMASLGLDPTQNQQELPGCDRLLVTPTMMQIPSAKMPSLEIIYGANTPNTKPGTNAQWNLEKLKSFVDSPAAISTPKKRINYLILVESGMQDEENTIKTYEEALSDLLTQYNVCAGATRLASRRIPGMRDMTDKDIRDGMRATIKAIKTDHPQVDFAVLLLKSRSIPIYSAFKDVTDRYESLQSLCLTQAPNLEYDRETKTSRCKGDITQYMANVMMKVNLKFGGGNHTVQVDNNSKSRIGNTLVGTLVLGADVTHPGGGSLIGCPSIASVVGSVDSHATKLRGSMRLQKICKAEIIDSLEAMVLERIQAYMSATKAPPKKILFYRDGVSTGQFAKVRDDELQQIRNACKKAGCGNALITVVIAVKRHATRFYPATSLAHKNGNCMPGTLVDQVVTSPHYSDFYLQSHHGLKGTAIPTHYMVIANEIGYGDRELQELTYKLCYTYARATIGVSYAPPAYYADRLCDRGRAYLRDWFSPSKDSAHYAAYLASRQAIETNKAQELTTAKAGLPAVPARPGRNAPRKSAAEIEVERAHEKKVEAQLEKDILAEAVTAWGKARTGGPGPWAEILDKTMFWM